MYLHNSSRLSKVSHTYVGTRGSPYWETGAGGGAAGSATSCGCIVTGGTSV